MVQLLRDAPLGSGPAWDAENRLTGVAKYRVAMSGATANACLSMMLKDVTAKTTGRPLVGTAAVYVVALLGDVNADGTVANPADYNYAYGFNNLVTNQSNCRCDLDMTGRIGSGDYTIIAGNLNATASCTLPPAVLGLAYTWDAENRLAQVVTRRDPATTFYLGDTMVEFKYDYMGRRIEKKYSIWTGSDFVVQTNQRFIYDGWNPVLVLDGASSNAVKIKYTWGLDLSGSVQGAGGIGGRLALDTTVSTKCSGRWPAGIARSSRQGLAAQDLRSGTKNYWFLYDANGNVGQMLDATNLSAITTAAKYEYDPYGNTLSATGTYAAANPFRFSTKWFDTETGLSYYGYRYYDARLGKWISKDPMEEMGGLNLYSFCLNSPVFFVDSNGFWSLSEWYDTYVAKAIAKVKNLGSEVRSFVNAQMSVAGEGIANNLIPEMAELGRDLLNGKTGVRYRRDWRIKRNLHDYVELNFSGFVQGSVVSGKCCVKTEVGLRGGLTLKAKPAAVWFPLGGFPVFHFTGDIKGGYEFCLDKPLSRDGLTGSCGFTAAGGARWEQGAEVWGAKASAFFEVGIFGGWHYQFDTRENKLSGGLYSRLVASVDSGERWGWSYVKRHEFKYIYDWVGGEAGGEID